MIIKLSPQRSGKTLSMSKSGDILTINGETFDFTPLHDGGIIPAEAITSEAITGDIERIDGEIVLTIIMPHGANATYAQRFPEPITVTQDGEIELS